MKAWAYLSDGQWIPVCARDRGDARVFMLRNRVATCWLDLPRVRRLPWADELAAKEPCADWLLIPDALWLANGYAAPTKDGYG